jgi:hypothetical protein
MLGRGPNNSNNSNSCPPYTHRRARYLNCSGVIGSAPQSDGAQIEFAPSHIAFLSLLACRQIDDC